ncbi:MAG: spermidine/putrescine ABC transporter substrate-binding protein [Clostridia bacterium]|nr:spermidine/putrescine ABC transporter substrate-binding protein [Clostridia bacterium]
MKKFFCVVFSVLLIALSAMPAFAVESKNYDHLRGTEINVYNWGEYISDGSDGALDVNAQFEKETGIKVNYNTFDSNENMYNKLKGGGANYDIVIPSDYMIARLIEEGLVQKIDFSNIPNYANIMDKYKNLYFDPNNEYSVPYNVGMVGIIYNTKIVEGNPDSWDLMWNEKYSGQIMNFNNPRDAFAVAQFKLGISINTTDANQWERAYEELKKQKPLVQSYVMDEVFNKMESGEAAIVSYYAGDFLTMHDNNPDLAFYYPKEGMNIFVDSVCIPTSSQNKEAAELYINFLAREDIALANAEYLCYASPNKKVLENEDYSLRDEEILYPANQDELITEYFHNLDPDTQFIMTSLWDNLKIDGNQITGVYIGLISFVVIVAVLVIFTTVRKKRRASYYD